MFLSDISIKRPIMISMGLVVFLIFGALAYFTLPLNLMPDVELGYVTIQTIYPGAGPKEIETQITKKIEDAVTTISKIDFVRSYSMESVSLIIIRFELGKDPDIANQEVKDKVNAILNDLPTDAELPIVEKFDIGAEPIIDVVLTGTLPMRELYEIADKNIKDRFSQIEGVAKVDIVGGEEREIRVEFENRIVYQNSLSLVQLGQILAVHNMDIPGGHFQQQTQEYSVRFNGEYNDVETIKELEIPTNFGVKKLSQLAEIVDTGAEIRERTIFFDNIQKLRNDNVILFSISKSADGNTVKMATSIRERLPEIEQELPPGCKLEVVRDESTFIESTVKDTLNNIVLGVILTGLVLLFFLHDYRSTIIIALAMPMSIISTFMMLQIYDFSLNIMTLMGLSTAVGILVTNSVIVLENIFRHKEMGHNRRLAAETGTSEISVAVIASTMTNIVVFLPIATMSSLMGMFFKEFALTVTFATIFSLIISFTLTPMMASLVIPEVDTKKHPIGERLEHLFHAWEKAYQKLLRFILKNKIRSMSVVIVSITLFIISLFVAKQVGFEFMPILDEGNINIEVELPQGYNLDETARLIETIEDRIKLHKEVKHILTTLGSLSEIDIGTNMAKVMVKLTGSKERKIITTEAANLFIKELSDIPNAKIRVAAVSSVGSGEAPIEFYLLGQNIDKLENYKNKLYESIKNINGLVNLNTSSRSGKPEITLNPDRQKMSKAGLTVYDLAMTLRSAIEGIVATHYKEEGNEYDIRVCLSEESVDTPEEVGNITIVAPDGTYRLSQFADIQFTDGYSKILHNDKFKAIEFSGYNAPGVPIGNIVNQIKEKIEQLNLPVGYKIDWGGDVKMMNETISDMLKAFILALLLTYMLLAAILESLIQPFFILGTVPLALIGVFFALFIAGLTMNTVSMMAIIMLLGIVVNNAILLLDYTNALRKQGKDIQTALIEACPTKFKAIVMATIAIILGMLPMALGLGDAGKEIRQPMGIVSIGGLIVSSLLTLIVIPSIYYLTTKSEKQSERSSS